jgi:hypothetical protein
MLLGTNTTPGPALGLCMGVTREHLLDAVVYYSIASSVLAFVPVGGDVGTRPVGEYRRKYRLVGSLSRRRLGANTTQLIRSLRAKGSLVDSIIL